MPAHRFSASASALGDVISRLRDPALRERAESVACCVSEGDTPTFATGRYGRCSRCGHTADLHTRIARRIGVATPWAERLGPDTRRSRRNITYISYQAMVGRCYSPATSGYARYGGAGIIVCDRWRNSFSTFVADMGERPGLEFTIDRKDSTGNYEPSNCRWATHKSQQRNRGNNRRIEYSGERLCISEWAEKTGLEFQLIQWRLNNGWTPEEIFTTPSGARRAMKPRQQSATRITFNGKETTLIDAAIESGLKPDTVEARLRRGWSVDMALSVKADARHRRVVR